jgi:four helix bundle protein
MARIERFEDIAAWQKARELTRMVYQLTQSGEFSRDFGFRDQARRAATSIMSNIAEGFERGGNKEFRRYLAIAKGSVGEVRSQLYVALDAEFLSQSQFDQLCNLAVEVSRLISGFIRHLDQSDFQGSTYKRPSEP